MSRRGRDFRAKPEDNESQIKSWKETYRQRCTDRLRDSRFKYLLAKRRSDSFQENDDVGGSVIGKAIMRQAVKERVLKDVQAMMSSEWEHLQKEAGDSASEGIMPADIPSPSVDEMISLMEDILVELRLEKSQQSKEAEEVLCDELVKKEEEELCLAFHRLNAVEVICPICQKHCLEEQSGLISCKCGIRIDTEQDCISLKNVSDNLRNGVAEHEANCEQEPCFSQTENFGISNLIMACQSCDFYYIIV